MTDDYHETVRILGVIMILISLPGLYFNISVFSYFLSIKKTSFYILCISKTISNSLVLLIYLFYNGPCALFFTIIGSEALDSYMNQAVGYGLYIIGPLTQTLASINRFLVVWGSPKHVPRYSNRVTVAILVIFWIFGLYCSTLWGFSDSCSLRVALEPFDWPTPHCDDAEWFFDYFTYLVIFLGLFSNSFNFLVVVRLLFFAVNSKTLSTESSKRRQKSTVRLFIQNCLQDWLFVFDTVNVIYIGNTFSKPAPQMLLFVTAIGSNLFIHAADGFVMYMFHYNSAKGRKVSTVTVSPKTSNARL